ncbi:DUF6158 family protein [Solwaraspora sp. WMMD406]|uniref:DUF6158 family protein n=1 Tax=Solwaraspora sp. WMMD406 TaxID=3016095 RepID=UPI002417149D|nr:DUF6158 family protein [Solwaraspora sp. WMMD406]MDG4767372.1 DUF6158 family protein [Solwaraspora sp. WMMD406]
MMTESVRYGDYSPSTAGVPFEPRPEPSRFGGTGSDTAGVDPTDGYGVAPVVDEPGVDPVELTDDDLLREMTSLHRTRLDTLRHGTDAALATHLRRTADLETEYLTRHPGREIDPARLRDGR